MFFIYTTGSLFLRLFILIALYTEEVTSVCKCTEDCVKLKNHEVKCVNSAPPVVANGTATYYV